MQNLKSVLEAAGQQPVDLDGKALVLPFGGRIMGLYPNDDLNAFWVNPAFEADSTARALLEEPGWINFGGDRTWISPEVDTHIADPERMSDTYEVPKAIDPAAYEVLDHGDRHVSIGTDARLAFMRSGVALDCRVTKTVTLADDVPCEIPTGVTWAGYRLATRLEVTDRPKNVHPALWNLIQVPGGGRIRIPVRPGCEPAPFIAEPVYTVEGGEVHCDVEAEVGFKYSLRADDCIGPLVYMNLSADRPFMVVRQHDIRDAELYTDVATHNLDDTGYVQQVYVADGASGGFGELEYHTPALGKVEGDAIDDVSHAWAFAGPAESLSKIYESLVS